MRSVLAACVLAGLESQTMNRRWTNDGEGRLHDYREHFIYRIDLPGRTSCYIGLTANLEERINSHCSNPKEPMHNYLAKYRDNPSQARQFFRVVDGATGFKEAEEKETAHIMSAFLESCDPAWPVPRNKKTHQIGPESFEKIAAIAERARAAQGIFEDSKRFDGEKKRLNKLYDEEKRRLTRLVDTEIASRKRIEREKQMYQTLCILCLLVFGALAILAFGAD